MNSKTLPSMILHSETQTPLIILIKKLAQLVGGSLSSMMQEKQKEDLVYLTMKFLWDSDQKDPFFLTLSNAF